MTERCGHCSCWMSVKGMGMRKGICQSNKCPNQKYPVYNKKGKICGHYTNETYVCSNFSTAIGYEQNDFNNEEYKYTDE